MALMGMKHKLGRGVRLFISYGIDWLVSLIIIVAVTLYLDRFQHFREFDLTDTSIQYPQVNPETIPVVVLGGIIGASFIIPAIANVLTVRSWWDLHHSLLGVNIGYAIAGSLTQGIRVVAGRPRPDFISRCNPPANATNLVSFGLANVTICADPTSALVKDGMRSFFSGHASLTAAGMGFCSLYLAGKLHLFNDKGYITKVWLCLLPLAGTIYVCITRTMDNKHHWEDVTIGALLGFFCAYFAYRQFYPSLTSENSHLPLAPRFPITEKLHAPREIVLTPGGREIGADSRSGGGLYSEGGMGYMHSTQAMQHGRPPYDRASTSDMEAGRGSMYKGSEEGYRPPPHVYGEEYPLVPR